VPRNLLAQRAKADNLALAILEAMVGGRNLNVLGRWMIRRAELVTTGTGSVGGNEKNSSSCKDP
jgi:hypothetical protein